MAIYRKVKCLVVHKRSCSNLTICLLHNLFSFWPVDGLVSELTYSNYQYWWVMIVFILHYISLLDNVLGRELRVLNVTAMQNGKRKLQNASHAKGSISY